MKVCKYGQKGTHIKIMQAYLKHRGFTNDRNQPIAVDGSFGPSTKQALLKFQKSAFKNDPTQWDGMCGPACWKQLAYYVPSLYKSNLWVQKIPFSKISAFDVQCKNGVKKSVLSYNQNSNNLCTINAVFFNMGGGSTSWYNTTDLVINGVLQNYGGNYTNKGLCIDKRSGLSIYQSTTEECIGKVGTIFVGGNPICIQNGAINYDLKGIAKSFIYTSAKSYRHGIGITGNQELVKITTATASKCSVPDLAKEALKQGCVSFINCDGGGSVAEAIGGVSMYTQGRGVPTVFGFSFKF